MNVEEILNKALDLKDIDVEEAEFLYHNAALPELMLAGHHLRNLHKNNSPYVTWMIDRNVNTTNVCVANCKFCNFFRVPGHPESYVTDIETYKRKIEETIRWGGDQLLLQGGHHPELGLEYYVNLFSQLKSLYPNIKLHALGPPEIVHISKISHKSYEDCLIALRNAGLDSLPGAGAEILSNRVRRLISKGKCSGEEWLEVMRVAHKLNIPTSSTMMFGHVETIRERMEHILSMRNLQAQKPTYSKGFLAFIPWPYQDEGTVLRRIRNIKNECSPNEYIRMIALSRILLNNIENIQASWLTVGKKTAQVCLHAGANDMGSIMLEENVVSAAGAPHRFTYKQIQEAISEAGFIPRLRTQTYEFREIPENIEEQVIDY
ncbi:MAG: CofH family radical SAM protein [Bacteroidia bacterium]|nr:CofH family radical SAM protein [Bacteroidia bacterium]